MTEPKLPELAELLDVATLRARLAGIADARATLAGVTPFYLRWKPGTSALLGVRLTWQNDEGVTETLASLYLGDGLAEAAEKAGTLRLLEPPLGPALARLDDALFLAFPNDRLLKGLSAVADVRRVGNRLRAPGTAFAVAGLRVKKSRGSHVRVVRWKPGRRAVLELDLTLVNDATGFKASWHTFARVLPAGELDARLARWQAAARVPAVAAPAVLFVDHERGWFATAAVPGRALAATNATPALLAALHAAFVELHAAHAPSLGTRPDRDDLAAATRALEALARVEPELAGRALALASRLAERLVSLAPAPCVFTHGDLGADQLLVEGDHVRVIDWDEAANGDPHADWASLIADLRGRGIATAWAEALARGVLGDRFDATRLGWQLAAAEARRVIEALQRGRADWRVRALDALAASELALAAITPAVPVAVPAPREGLAAWLAALADAERRFSVPGVDPDASRVAAVWPDGEGGAIVRLEHPSEPGTVVRWLELGDSVRVFDFPSDPALPALASLLAGGGFRAAGHRLGKRAALRETRGTRFLFLRPEGGVAKAYARVHEAHRRLAEAGVPSSRPLEVAQDVPGWWAERVSGRTLVPANETSATWERLGATLARAHAAHTEAGVASGLAAAVQAGRKQLALVRLADPAFAAALERDLAAVDVSRAAGHAVWVHGDLHPLQILIGDELVILDWERARAGEAEEDLGNFLAHLAWEAFDAAPTAWHALLSGYAEAGGEWDHDILMAHARASLARVRAVHGWRDGSRERARDGERWSAWQEGIASW